MNISFDVYIASDDKAVISGINSNIDAFYSYQSLSYIKYHLFFFVFTFNFNIYFSPPRGETWWIFNVTNRHKSRSSCCWYIYFFLFPSSSSALFSFLSFSSPFCKSEPQISFFHSFFS